MSPSPLRRRASCIAVACLLVGASGVRAQLAKQVAAPPDEIVSGRLALPDPLDAADRSRTAWVEVRFDAQGRFAATLPPADSGRWSVVPLAPDADAWAIASDASGASLPLDADVAAGRATRWQGEGFPGLDVALARTDLPPSGARAVRLEVARAGAPAGRARRAPDGVLLVADGGTLELVSHLSSFDLVCGAPLAMLASLRDPVLGDVPLPVRDATLTVTLGDAGGDLLTLPLRDDGRALDGAPGDGVFGALLPPLPAGDLSARVQASGTTADGRAFLRTGRHAFPMHAPEGALDGDASVDVLADGRLALALGTSAFPPARRLHVAAEVWGTLADGAFAPLAWLARMQAVASDGTVTLALDPGWIARAGAGEPFELRAVRLSDPDTLVPLARAERLPLPPRGLALSAPPPPITPTLTMGPPGVLGLSDHGADAASGATLAGAKLLRELMLVHGYCSQGVWPLGDFHGHLLDFLDPDANRSHDAFAQLLLAFGDDALSYGGVAHSQGGAALLHLYTNYFSGLDLAGPGKLIQSVGTPYQGTPLAGDLASLGSIFGSGCGTNDDMTPAGSALWLSTIPGWARAEVSYRTTSTSGLWCNFATWLVLSSPNDGVVERSRGQLPGAENVGHVTGWCHTTGMNDPAQYLDHVRNQQMDAAAAR